MANYADSCCERCGGPLVVYAKLKWAFNWVHRNPAECVRYTEERVRRETEERVRKELTEQKVTQ